MNPRQPLVLETLSLHHYDWSLSGDIKKILHDYVFSQLPEKAKICIVGCGQGQLAYSIAMEIAEYENQNAVEKNFQIFATDSLSSNLKTAEAGVYTQQQLDPLCAEYRKRYVVAGDVAGKFKIKNKIRHTINFLQYNLAADSVSDTKLPDEIDLIVCPEALVYFTSSDKEKITLQLSKMLKSGGVFLTGGSQLLLPQAVMSESCSLERVNHSSGDFYRRIN